MAPGACVALYGRFSSGERSRFATAIVERGGRVARPNAPAGFLVVGALAGSLAENGALQDRLAQAAADGSAVFGERGFVRWLDGDPPKAAAFPIQRALTGLSLELDDAPLLAAFDLIAFDGACCGFGDVATLRAADGLRRAGHGWGEVVRALTAVRDRAPAGRRRLAIGPDGEALLAWEDGVTTLDGQGLLPIEPGAPANPFDAAAHAEAEGDLAEAARLYDLAARTDRRCPIAPYNLGNLQLNAGNPQAAALAYRRALARDPGLIEARYNLAQALEAMGRLEEADTELATVLERAPRHLDALFNLAQLRLAQGADADAKALYTRYLACDPPVDWANKARRALAVCAARKLA